MVVQFTPAPEGAGRTRAAGDDHLAPVSYLPGAGSSATDVNGLTETESIRDRLRQLEESRGRRRSRPSSAHDGGLSDGADDDDHDSSVPARPEQKQTKRASNVSMHQLARRGMSRWELQQVLDKRGVETDTARAELDRLESVGLLDDAALAVTLVYTQHTRNGLGRSAIAQELRRRHIDQEIIDDALSEIADDDERERALELAVRRARQLSGLDEVTAVRRLSGYLARKGYSSEVVRAAVTEALKSPSVE